MAPQQPGEESDRTNRAMFYLVAGDATLRRHNLTMIESMPGIGILVGTRGRGSNMRAIAEACASGEVAARVQVVVSPKEGTAAVEAARGLGLRVEVIPYDDDAYHVKLLASLAKCDLICLAGYMRLLPKVILEAFPNRILNIHPALLPKFGGKGMYGRHVHEAVLAARETESGVTVHLVNEHYDEGEIVLQLKCPVLAGDTPESLAERVLKLEHRAYPQAISALLGQPPVN